MNDNILFIVVAAIVGYIHGGYLNTLEYRMRSEYMVFTADCYCPSCKSKLKLYDQIPIFSYLILKGKCRSCGEKIGIRYPIVEAATMLMWTLAAIFTDTLGVAGIGFAAELLYIIVSVILAKPEKPNFLKYLRGLSVLVMLTFISLLALIIGEVAG